MNTINKILKNYQTIMNSQNRTVGSVIRHYRKKKGLTLDETSKGICSISYLCKVERDQLVINEERLTKLIERLEIDITDINPDIKDTSYIVDIVNNNKVNFKILNKYKGKNDYQSKLIKYAKYLLNDFNIVLAQKSKSELINYYPNFNKEELEFFLYLILNEQYQSEQYKDVVDSFINLEYFSSNINILFNSILIVLNTLYLLDNFNDINTITKKYLNDFYRYNKFDNIIAIKNIELKILAKTATKENIIKELELISNYNLDENIIWFLYYFFNENNYNKALIYSQKIKKINTRWFIKHLETLKLSNNVNLLIKELDDIKDYQLTQSQEIYINLLKMEYINKEDPIEFDDILYVDQITQDTFILSTIYNALLKASKDKFLYKRSVEILEKKNKILKEKASIIYKK